MKRKSQANVDGFSLVEIALALGVIAFALVGILGLMSGALEAGRISREETQATLVANGVMAEVRSGSYPGASVRTTGTVGRETYKDLNFQTTPAGALYVVFNSNGTAARELASKAAYDGAIRGTDAYFVTRLEWSPAENPVPPLGAMTNLTVSVETPCGAPSSRRARYLFTTRIGP